MNKIVDIEKIENLEQNNRIYQGYNIYLYNGRIIKCYIEKDNYSYYDIFILSSNLTFIDNNYDVLSINWLSNINGEIKNLINQELYDELKMFYNAII